MILKFEKKKKFNYLLILNKIKKKEIKLNKQINN